MAGGFPSMLPVQPPQGPERWHWQEQAQEGCVQQVPLGGSLPATPPLRYELRYDNGMGPQTAPDTDGWPPASMQVTGA